MIWQRLMLNPRNVFKLCFFPISFSELSLQVFFPSTRTSNVFLSNLPGAKCQGGLWVSCHLRGARALLWVSAGQSARGQHLPQHGPVRVHGGPQEEQRQPVLPQPVPPDLGAARRREALHLHLQGLPRGELEGEQHGGAPQWVFRRLTAVCLKNNWLKETFSFFTGILPICSAISVMFESAPWFLSLLMSLPVAVGLLNPWMFTFTRYKVNRHHILD